MIEQINQTHAFAKLVLQICYISFNQTPGLIKRNVQYSCTPYTSGIGREMPCSKNSGRGSRRAFHFEKPILLISMNQYNCTVHF